MGSQLPLLCFYHHQQQQKNLGSLIILIVIGLLSAAVVSSSSSSSSSSNGSSTDRKVYIVYCGHHDGLKTLEEITESHHSLLQNAKDDSDEEDVRNSIVYSYKNSINGFAALLSEEEAAKLSEKDEVLSVFPSQALELHTTRSWEFLTSQPQPILSGRGVASAGEKYSQTVRGILLNKAKEIQDVIVGVLDSGIWPESKSFQDEGMEPVPKRWKGVCQVGDAFNSSNCNRKIIGARYYLKAYEAQYGKLNTTVDYLSPRDHDGHGTHTASTSTGRLVPDVFALGGFAQGEASGGAPIVRLAVYKVCWPVPGQEYADGNTCFEADMLAAMDDAIGDGVDVISISIGVTGTQPSYTQDGIALGALHAIKAQIVTVCSAGNSGPTPSTTSNTAPWIITVAASSVDRRFVSPVVLGDGLVVEGQTATPSTLEDRFFPLVYAGNVSIEGTPNNVSGMCLPGSLDSSKVKGKIVLCLRGNVTRVAKGFEVRRAGGAGMILGNSIDNGNELSIDVHVLPATAVVYDDATKILNYISSNDDPKAKIIPGKTELGVKPAPYMASFSSVGPSSLEPNILKPDITAPGLNILAAWSESSSPTKLSEDSRRVAYNLLSGTSMSCPHVSGVAALLKALHPEWSSAAIRSALMTTAILTNNMGLPIANGSGDPASPFNFGSGHLNPIAAMDPGLVYNASYKDYMLFMCRSGVKSIYLNFTCPKDPPTPSKLNYPSVAITGLKHKVKLTRKVTNVGNGEATYVSSVSSPLGVRVEIYPKVLHFKTNGQVQKFTLRFEVMTGATKNVTTGIGGVLDNYVFGSYSWSDGVHIVRSPIVVSLNVTK